MVKGKIVFPDTYNRNFACGNCSTSVCLRIPLGVTVQKYAEDHKCPNCGCNFIHQGDESYAQPTGSPMIYLPYSLRRGQW